MRMLVGDSVLNFWPCKGRTKILPNRHDIARVSDEDFRKTGRKNTTENEGISTLFQSRLNVGLLRDGSSKSSDGFPSAAGAKILGNPGACSPGKF